MESKGFSIKCLLSFISETNCNLNYIKKGRDDHVKNDLAKKLLKTLINVVPEQKATSSSTSGGLAIL